ncbi:MULTISPECIES: hypothetical protein [Staphylococcus]|uniref:hypothetical protein n=1 Tax=Staphylococcus TaxID=1279 RepID=UPI000D1F9717|nr:MULTISPECIES: hypothetical protein [Staphylococcus]MCM3103565.1 hypothetical protein [Staphylococcus warneri]MEB7381769.1 hypothetical protein [Staphylococcus warneri]PTI09376.1 hypothetical protein BU087_05805 [Staphylococcus warneri]
MENNQNDKLTYILMIIAGLICILNGVLVFDQTIIMILLSVLFIIIGLIVSYISINGFRHKLK